MVRAKSGRLPLPNARAARRSRPMIGGGVASGFDPAIKKDGTVLEDGSIALQAESQPVEFRNVRLLDLSGCMKPESPAYRAYFVHRDDTRCTTR